jgi:hypothetical protein
MRFLRAVFIPPKFSELETTLFQQVSHLEAQLSIEREKYQELAQRIMFPDTPPVDYSNRGPHTLEPSVSKEQMERKRLSDLSKLRWQEHVSRQEQRAAELMQLDDARAKDARNETASGQSS